LIELLVSSIISFSNLLLFIEIVGKNFSIFINAAILDNIPGMNAKIFMSPEPPGQEEDLAVESPGLHILVEISQVRIFSFWFKKWCPIEIVTKLLH